MTQEQIREKIKEVAETIGNKFKPEKIILFGSYVWGKPGPDSDIDLLVIEGYRQIDKSRIERQEEINSFLSPRIIPMDILVYTSAEIEEQINSKRNLFLEDIVRNGEIIYSKRGGHEVAIDYQRPFAVIP